MVSAVLSGIVTASGHPLYQATDPVMYLLPDRVSGHSTEISSPNFSSG